VDDGATERRHPLERRGHVVDGEVRKREGVAGASSPLVDSHRRGAAAGLPPLPLAGPARVELGSEQLAPEPPCPLDVVGGKLDQGRLRRGHPADDSAGLTETRLAARDLAAPVRFRRSFAAEPLPLPYIYWMVASAVLVLSLQTPPSVPPGDVGVSLQIAAAVLLGCVLLTAAVVVLDRRRRSHTVDEEQLSRAAMDELCPHGWRAQLALYGPGAPMPEDAPLVAGPLVSVDWAEYAAAADVGGEVRIAVMRRSWGRSIAGALRAMVADRRLDRTLEEIEQQVPTDP
jgi:hypothetical protein